LPINSNQPTNADDIILLATSESELQEMVYCLDRVSHKHSLLINVDKTRVMASNGIVCRILIQNEQLEQLDPFPYLGSLAENVEKSQQTDFNEDTANESASVGSSNVRL